MLVTLDRFMSYKVVWLYITPIVSCKPIVLHKTSLDYLLSELASAGILFTIVSYYICECIFRLYCCLCTLYFVSCLL